MKKGLKVFLFVTGVFMLLLVLTVLFISPITKYLIEKHSEEYTGRKITMEGLSINIFNGKLKANGLKIKEAASKADFFACDELELNLAVYKLWAAQYEISSLRISRPYIQVIQQGNRFNYDDLLKRFVYNDAAVKKDTAAAPVKYRVRNIRIEQAKMLYTNTKPLTRIELKQVDIQVPQVAWNDPLYRAHASFVLGSGGGGQADLLLNADTYDYVLRTKADQVNIAFMYPYLKDYLKINSLAGWIGGDIRLKGNLNQPTAIAASGEINAGRFALIDNTNELLTAIEATRVKIDTLNTAKNMFNFSEILISRPFVRVSMYNKGFNYERIMTTPLAVSGDTSSKVYSNVFLMMSSYIQDIVRQYDVNNYKINSLRITGGQCIFTDFTHGDKFRYVLDSLNMSSDRLNSNNPFLVFSVKARLNTSGKMQGTLKVDPRHYKDIDIDASIKDLLITDFNPYSKYYVATPFLQGTISYVNRTTVMGGKLDSKNVLDIKQIKTGKKVKNSTAMNLPVPLAVSLLKDVKGNIHLDIPVKGSLDDPKFRWGRVVWQVVKNLIVKAATAPFRLLANLFGGKEEDFKEMQFEYIQTDILANQQAILDRLARVAADKPDLLLELVQVTNLQDEREALAVYETKKKYLGIGDAASGTDLRSRIDSVRNNDSLFVQYINARASGNLQSTEEKCVQLIGKDRLDPVVQSFLLRRNEAVMNYLTQQKGIPASRVVISNTKETNQLQKSAPPRYVINVAVKE